MDTTISPEQEVVSTAASLYAKRGWSHYPTPEARSERNLPGVYATLLKRYGDTVKADEWLTKKVGPKRASELKDKWQKKRETTSP